MATPKVHLLAGRWPGPRLQSLLDERESLYARFEDDPRRQIWVCSRLVNTIYAAPLRRCEEWVAR